MSILSLTIVLFLIMDPIGSVSSFNKTLETVAPARRRWVIAREMLIALFLMLVFNTIGEGLFSFLQVSETTVRLASGVILFFGALRILFPPAVEPEIKLPEGEPFIVPLAIPGVAGPALLATIMLFARITIGFTPMFIAILIAWGLSFAILFFSKRLTKIFGHSGLMACERLMGMILVLMAIQRFMDGIQLFVDTLPK